MDTLRANCCFTLLWVAKIPNMGAKQAQVIWVAVRAYMTDALNVSIAPFEGIVPMKLASALWGVKPRASHKLFELHFPNNPSCLTVCLPHWPTGDGRCHRYACWYCMCTPAQFWWLPLSDQPCDLSTPQYPIRAHSSKLLRPSLGSLACYIGGNCCAFPDRLRSGLLAKC